jgi:ABC-2 type transport system permease protein
MRATNTIYTMWLREMKRFFRAKSRIVGNLAMPMFFLVLLGAGFSSFIQFGSVNYMEFIAPGIIGMILLFSSMFAGISILWDRQFGFLKEVLVAPVGRFSIMVGKTLGSVTTSLLQAFIILVAVMVFGLVSPTLIGVLLALVFMFLISASFVALGIAFASRMEDAHGFQLIMNFIIMPIFFLSGALFPLSGLPAWLENATLFDPLTYGVDGLRGSLGGVSHFPLWIDFTVLLGFWVFISLVGTYLFRKASV